MRKYSARKCSMERLSTSSSGRSTLLSRPPGNATSSFAMSRTRSKSSNTVKGTLITFQISKLKRMAMEPKKPRTLSREKEGDLQKCILIVIDKASQSLKKGQIDWFRVLMEMKPLKEEEEDPEGLKTKCRHLEFNKIKFQNTSEKNRLKSQLTHQIRVKLR